MGRGAEFNVYFPAVDGQPLSSDSFHDGNPLPRGKETILLVEDEDQVRAIMKHDGERKEARMENGTAIETWTYMANYENERMSQITFTAGKVTEIKDVPWGDEE